MGRKVEPEEPEKVHRLSLAELAAHDDACSDAMVDNVSCMIVVAYLLLTSI